MADTRFRIWDRTPIECGMAGEVVDISYGDAKTGMTRRIIAVEEIYEAAGTIMIDAFCGLRWDSRTFALDKVHMVSELPGGYYFSMVDWLASYGVPIDLQRRGGGYGYRVLWDLI